MEKMTFEITMDKLQEVILKHFTEVSNSSYSNPIRKAVEDAINAQQGIIRQCVDDVIKQSLLDPSFKEKLGEVVMGKMFESAFKK